jgi:site-specific recombinase XerD
MGAVVQLRDEVAPKRRTPMRRPNAELRTREHLTEREVERLIEAARGNRWGHRDATMILVAFRHGLRALGAGGPGAVLHVRRRKAGTPGTHPLGGIELRALRRLKREQEPTSQFVFVSERGDPFSTEGFARLLQRTAKISGLTIKVHPHMLRHACGFKLANDGRDTRSIQSYLGHKNIQHTVRYTELSPDRFRDFWRD